MRSTHGEAAASAELVAQLAALAAELAARPAPDSGAACFEQTETLGRAVDLIESAIAARVGVATRSGQVAEWGHASPTAWLRTTLAMRHARAEERATLAAQLPRLPQVAKRLTTGELSAGYATAIATGVRRLDETDCEKAEDLLLGFVDDGHSVTQITRFADKIKDLVAERDNTAAEPEDARHADRQWWTLHRSASGTFVKGRFGPELTALIKAKLEPLAAPCGADDTRDHAERLADALHTYLSNGDSRWDPILLINLKQPAWIPGDERDQAPAAAASPHFPNTSVSADDAPGQRESATGDKPRRRPTAAHSGAASDPSPERAQPAAAEATAQHRTRRQSESPGPTGAEPGRAMRWVPQPPAPSWPFDGTPFAARLLDGTPIRVDRARSILLNAGFSTLILGTDGQPLYLGRRVRCATPAQRRVLKVRYDTCVVDGCEIPSTNCQVDHIDGWENGQPTDIDHLVMCCAFHNRYKWRHPDRITITQRPDGRYHYQIARPEARPWSRNRSRLTSGSSDRGP
jgi:hypothetical protein